MVGGESLLFAFWGQVGVGPVYCLVAWEFGVVVLFWGLNQSLLAFGSGGRQYARARHPCRKESHRCCGSLRHVDPVWVRKPDHVKFPYWDYQIEKLILLVLAALAIQMGDLVLKALPLCLFAIGIVFFVSVVCSVDKTEIGYCLIYSSAHIKVEGHSCHLRSPRLKHRCSAHLEGRYH